MWVWLFYPDLAGGVVPGRVGKSSLIQAPIQGIL